MTAAPRLTASMTKLAPSALEPARAAKRKPGWTLRESSVRPAMTGSRGKALTPMSSLSNNATHSRSGRRLTAGARRQRLAFRHPATHRRGDDRSGRGWQGHGDRGRCDFERRLAAPVARQDAVKRHDILDDRLHAGRGHHAAGRIAAGFGDAMGLVERH